MNAVKCVVPGCHTMITNAPRKEVVCLVCRTSYCLRQEKLATGEMVTLLFSKSLNEYVPMGMTSDQESKDAPPVHNSGRSGQHDC